MPAGLELQMDMLSGIFEIIRGALCQGNGTTYVISLNKNYVNFSLKPKKLPLWRIEAQRRRFYRECPPPPPPPALGGVIVPVPALGGVIVPVPTHPPPTSPHPPQ